MRSGQPSTSDPGELRWLGSIQHEVVRELIETFRQQIPRIGIFGNQQHGFAQVFHVNFVAIEVKSLRQLHGLAGTLSNHGRALHGRFCSPQRPWSFLVKNRCSTVIILRLGKSRRKNGPPTASPGPEPYPMLELSQPRGVIRYRSQVSLATWANRD
jgi:hypothetical protein